LAALMRLGGTFFTISISAWPNQKKETTAQCSTQEPQRDVVALRLDKSESHHPRNKLIQFALHAVAPLRIAASLKVTAVGVCEQRGDIRALNLGHLR